VTELFVPGWGADASIYRAAVPAGWEILDPPSLTSSGATVEGYRAWLAAECRARHGRLVLAGHSFGAALAVLAALDTDLFVERLVLVSPSVLPLSKPLPLMLWDFSRRACSGWFPPGAAGRAVRRVVRHPRLARRLGNEVRRLDLADELSALRDRGVPCRVVAASSDTLTPPDLCRTAAELCGGEYREIEASGGHLWFLRAPRLFAAQLSADGR
jgi:pimeloyl-ACP methyl ester carboxylesterase